jgi:hypothetical protein
VFRLKIYPFFVPVCVINVPIQEPKASYKDSIRTYEKIHEIANHNYKISKTIKRKENMNTTDYIIIIIIIIIIIKWWFYQFMY